MLPRLDIEEMAEKVREGAIALRPASRDSLSLFNVPGFSMRLGSLLILFEIHIERE